MEQTSDQNVVVESPIPLWLIIAIAVVVSLISSIATWYIVQAQNATKKPMVVVVDMARLAISKSFQAAEVGEQPDVSAKRFLTQMETLNNKFTQEGILVINSQAAFNKPGNVDMTSLYAQALGIDLNKSK